MKRLLTILAVGALFNCAALDVAVRGKAPEFSIVIAENAHPAFQSAAKEFSDFVEQITGVRLPVTDDAKPLPQAAVLIGPNRHSQTLLGDAYKLDEMDDDSFQLKTIGKHVVVLGKKRGGQYGVYELLERFGKCRWYASWCSVIPKADTFSVPDNLDEFQKPAFLMREPFWFDMFRTMQAIRNKCNGSAMNLTEKNGGKICFADKLFVHTMDPLIPVAEFFDTHPEYFAEINGQRSNGYVQRCLSNPDVLRITTERVLDIIRKDPTATMYSVSQNDAFKYCTCEKCNALLKKYGTQAGVMIWFVNQVAEAVEKEFPNALIETLAYQYTREPPKNIVPRHNVVPRLCTIELDFAHSIMDSKCPENIKFRKDIEGWSSISKRLFIWDYVTDFSHYLSPYPNFYSLQGNVKFFRDNHVIGVMEQGAYSADHADFAELKGWILAKLLWNPDQDVMALLDDFMKGYYGAAEPFVRRYFDELHDRVKDPEFKLNTFMDIRNGYIDEEFLDHAVELWESGIEAVKDDPVRHYNVRKGAMVPYYTIAALGRHVQPSYKWTDDSVTLNEDTRRVGNAALKLLEYAEPVDGRVTRVSEGEGVDGPFFKFCKTFSRDLPVKTIAADGMKFSVAPDLGASIGVLSGKDGYNYVSGAEGGFALLSFPVAAGAKDKFVVSDSSERGCELKGSYAGGKGYCDAKLTLEDGALKCDYVLASGANAAFDNTSCLRLAFNLDCEANALVKFGDGDWNEYVVDKNNNMESFQITDRIPADGKIAIASPKSGRAVSVDLRNNAFDAVRLMIMLETGTVKLCAYKTANIGATPVRHEVLVKPLGVIGGLPASKSFVKSDKVRVTVEDSSMGLACIGSWGEFVADIKADDGQAAKLYNTHYEWCLRIPVAFEKLSPGVKYQLRFRIRVDKRRDTGNAFWAGVYDPHDGKDAGIIVPSVTGLDNEYHWYTAAEWVPNAEHGQFVWAGPGQFGLEGSAINAVYVDRVEVVPVE